MIMASLNSIILNSDWVVVKQGSLPDGMTSNNVVIGTVQKVGSNAINSVGDTVVYIVNESKIQLTITDVYSIINQSDIIFTIPVGSPS